MNLGDVLAKRYELLRRIGAGGMGVVYHAHDQERCVNVALKTLLRVEPSAIYRLKQEFRALADIAHPNLVQFHELVSEADAWFFTMELIDGVPFTEYVRRDVQPLDALSAQGEPTSCTDETVVLEKGRRPLIPSSVDEERLLRALQQLALGVQTLHGAGMVHRDIKPSNVLVTAEGRVVLLDLGIVAELRRASFQQNTHQSIMGTPTYMAPEQVTNEALSPATDWYAVGVMLFEALTGRPPLVGKPMDVLMRKPRFEPPRPSERISGIPQDLDALCFELLRGNPEARPSGEEVLLRLGIDIDGSSAPLSVSTPARETLAFVGREREIDALREAFEETGRGKAITVHVHGSSGVGKSSLVRHFLNGVAEKEDVVVLDGRCYEHETVPYKALDGVVDSLSRFLNQLPRSDAEAILPLEVNALARLFPTLGRVDAVAQAPRRAREVPDPHELRRRAFGALRELLTRLALRRRLVVYIDDLQWGDIDSAALMIELLRPPEPPPFLTLFCYRSGEAAASPFLKELLASLPVTGSVNGVRELALDVLSPMETVDLALALAKEERASLALDPQQIVRESGGNPFFVGALVRYAQAGTRQAALSTEESRPSVGEITLAEVIQSRFDTLPEEARQLLEVISVAGRPLDEEAARRAAEISSGQQAPFALLRTGHLIRAAASGERHEVEAYHDRIREVVVAGLAPERLTVHHQRLAVAIEEDPEADPEEVAQHFKAAGERERAKSYTCRAADRAVAALAFDRAVSLYRLALELSPRDEDARDLRIKLGDALANVGRGREAADAYLSALSGASETESLDLKRRAFEQLLGAGYVDEGLMIMDEVLRALGFRPSRSRAGAVGSLILRRAQVRIRGLRYKERNEDQLSPECLTRIDTLWAISSRLGVIDTINGAHYQTNHLLLALNSGEPKRIARALGVEAVYSSTRGRSGHFRSSKLLSAQAKIAQRLGDPRMIGVGILCSGFVAQIKCQWKEGRRLCLEAERIFQERCTGAWWEIVESRGLSLYCMFMLGHIRELSHYAPNAIEEALDLGDRLQEAHLHTQYLPYQKLSADDIEGARREIADGMAPWPKKSFYLQHTFEILSRGNVDLYTGQGIGTWERLADRWSALKSSLLLKVQLVRITMLDLRARSALGAAEQANDRKSLLRAAERDARRIASERMHWSEPLARLIRAGVRAMRGNTDGAIEHLRDACTGFEAADGTMHASASRRRLGQLLGGDEGRALVEAADERMREEGIVRPDRWTAMLAPGFPD